MNTSRWLGLVFLAVVPSACSMPLHKRTAERDTNLITREQLLEHRFNTAFEAVQSLHSNWLQTRGVNSFNTPAVVLVYYDDVKLGGVETLHTIHVRPLSYIRRYDGNEATARWGVGHNAGVIFVSTHSAPITSK